MTSSTAIIKAVPDGTATDTTDAKPAQRVDGIARARQLQVYHVTGLAETALTEARRLLITVNDTAWQAGPRNEEDGTYPLDLASVASSLNEAMDCIDLAAEYLSGLNIQLRSLTTAED